MEAAFEIDFSELTNAAIRRLLRDALRQQAINSMPEGKRAAARRRYEENADDEDGEDENDAKVEMNRRGVKPTLPSVTSEDLPRGMKMGKYKGRKHGKGS